MYCHEYLIELYIPQEADIATNFLRPDSVPNEPVLISSPLVPADVGILTNVYKPTMHSADTTDVIYHFDVLSYTFFAIAIFFIIVMITTSVANKDILKGDRGFLSFQKVVLKVQETVWEIVTLIIDQEYFEPSIWSARIVWCAANIFCFVLIFGFFLNLLSTDQSVQRDTKKIDSIKDILYDPHFKEIRPVIFKPLYLYNVLKDVPPSSDEGKLFRHMKNIGNASIFDINMADANPNGPIREFISDIGSGKSALLTARYAMELVVLIIPKMLGTEETESKIFHVSKNSFLKGTLNIFYSKRIHPHIKQYMDYRLVGLSE